MKTLPNEYTIQCKECGNIYKSRATWKKDAYTHPKHEFRECGSCGVRELCGRTTATKTCYRFISSHQCTLCGTITQISRNFRDTAIDLYNWWEDSED